MVLLLRAGPLALDLAPEAGGSIVRFSIDDLDVLRPMTAAAITSGRGNDAAAYPLVPYSNRIANGRLEFEGEVFQLERNWPGVGHPMHGDGWAVPWTVTEASRDQAEIAFEHAHPVPGGWPFRYRARQRYRLEADRLTVTLAIENLEERAVPAGLGLHPFFVREEDTELRFDSRAVWRTDAEVLPLDRVAVPVEWRFSMTRRVDPVTLDNCFDGWDGGATICWPRRRLRLDLKASLLFRHLVVYIPPGKSYFCVEPVSHASGDVSALPLGPGATRTGEIVFQLAQS